MNNKNKKRLARIILMVLGLLLLAVLIYRVGPREVWENTRQVGYYFILTCFIALGWIFLQSAAWAIVQSAFKPVPFRALFKARIMADGVTTLVPMSANVGGEAARAIIIRKYSPLREGIPGILFDKTVESFASLVFLTTGLFISILYLKIPEKYETSALTVLISITIVIAVMIIFQLKGVYGILHRLARIFPRSRQWFLEKEEILRQFDRNMRTLFRHSRLKLVAAFLMHFASRWLGVLEVYVIVRALGWPAPPIKMLFMSVFVVIANTAFFLIPGQWGAAEGASLLAATTVGYPAAIGLSIGLVRRVRKVVYALITVILMQTGRQKLKLPAREMNNLNKPV
ncbi:MAG: lysylphosphatidylglycerol synthase transmembrane domain-containing protein [Candidatus Saccharicenans sp.]|uniref:lysylphosphatidylglycerol synthase transmembrane domain-containing protein n=1 Tax=Candidatus Saccharicenans sp. TaxID=2819258 RepID=UPI00404A3D21